MSEEITETEFEEYECSRGTVIGHELTTTPQQYIIRTPDGAVIGLPANGEPSEQNVAADLADPPTVPAPVPTQVRNAQLRRRLLAMGLLAQVETAVESAGMDAQIRWYQEQGINRADPLVAAIGGVLNLTSADIDDIFREAAKLG